MRLGFSTVWAAGFLWARFWGAMRSLWNPREVDEGGEGEVEVELAGSCWSSAAWLRSCLLLAAGILGLVLLLLLLLLPVLSSEADWLWGAGLTALARMMRWGFWGDVVEWLEPMVIVSQTIWVAVSPYTVVNLHNVTSQ
jgi:hypothetical protein